jgi:SAM-dependent methyltransferase
MAGLSRSGFRNPALVSPELPEVWNAGSAGMTLAADWSGRVGEVWAEQWRRTERAFSALEPVLEAAILAVAPERGCFLDIGCGVGTTSLAVARACPAAHVIGADLAADMVAIARQRASKTANAEFIAGDVLDLLDRSHSRDSGLEPGSHFFAEDPRSGTQGQSQSDERRFDLFFSRHGVMFFSDPVAAFRTLHDAGSPGASLVFTCFAAAAANPWATLVTEPPEPTARYAPGPFAFADPAITRAILEAAGWTATVERIDFTYRVGEGDDPLADALAFLSRIGPAASAMRDAEPGAREALRARLAERLERQRRGDAIDFPAAAWLWTARA